ncbi:hypothetical protein, partial [Arthrobacter sp. ES1]|uniref:hypothetical protein n=1 Tax=Arthrobacter sp. ES1 TaxID=1897056 RepID=UPI001CFFA4B9
SGATRAPATSPRAAVDHLAAGRRQDVPAFVFPERHDRRSRRRPGATWPGRALRRNRRLG